MFLDILGVVIGFAVIMLLLSLLVTSLVQVTQHLLRLRARNFEYGLQALLQRVRNSGDGYDAAKAAKTVLESATLTPQGSSFVPGKFLSLMGSGKCSHLTQEELGAHLDRIGEAIPVGRVADVKKAYPEIEKHIKKRLVLVMRYVAIFWALLIAFYFQVSAPELLTRLSTEPALRAQYVSQVNSILSQAETTLTRLGSYQDISDHALLELQDRHPDLVPLLEEASGIGADRADILKELHDVLEDVPDRRNELIQEYEQVLDRLHEQGLETATSEADAAMSQLAQINIHPWPYGLSFYGHLGNWIGVLMTAVFLTLGAPSWFHVLKNATKLRDMLKPLKK